MARSGGEVVTEQIFETVGVYSERLEQGCLIAAGIQRYSVILHVLHDLHG